jgi:hypothetical protein
MPIHKIDILPSGNTNNIVTGSLMMTYSENNTEFNNARCRFSFEVTRPSSIELEDVEVLEPTDGQYLLPIFSGSTIQFLRAFGDAIITSNISIYRRDYTCDDVDGNLGINDTYITGNTVTFTSLSSKNIIGSLPIVCPTTSYNFEYRAIADSYDGFPMIISSGLTIYVDGSPASYPGTGTTWNSRVTGSTTYNGTIFGSPVWSTTQNGFFTFDAINDYVDFGNSSKGSDTTSYTYGGWVKCVTGSTQEVFFQRGSDVGEPSGFTGWSQQLSKTNANKFKAAFVYTSILGVFEVNTISTTTMINDLWYYVVARWTAGSGISIFVNGINETTTSNVNSNLRPDVSGWLIALENADFDRPSVGDFSVYNRALSDAEVLSNYNAKKSLYEFLATPTPTPSASPTPSPTPTLTNTPTPTATATITPTPTPFTLPMIITSGLTVYVDGSTSSYSGSGTTWFNRAPIGVTINGTILGGPTWSSSQNGFFTFDGVNDAVDFGGISKWSDNDSFTFGGWMKCPTGSTQEIFCQRGLDGGTGNGWSLQLGKNTSNRFFASYVASPLAVGTATGTTTMVSNQWYYIVGRWTRSSSIAIFVNGLIETSVSSTSATLRGDTSGFVIALENTDFDSLSVGDFEMYNRSLSDAEVLTNFNTKKSFYGY